MKGIDDKIKQMNRIYGTNVKKKNIVKKHANKPPKTPKNAQPPIVEEDEKESSPIEDQCLDETLNEEKEVKRKFSLPPIKENRPFSQAERTVAKPEKRRRLSLPNINSTNATVSQVLKLDEKGDTVTTTVHDKPVAFEKTPVFTEPTLPPINANHRPRYAKRHSMFHAKVFTPQSSNNHRRATIQPADVEKLLAAYGETGNLFKEKDLKRIRQDIGAFQRIAKKVGRAKLFGNFLNEDLNLRYIHAVLNDPDYNEKYKRMATPDIETDEENDEEILRDLCNQGETPMESESEESMKATDGGSNDEDTDSDNEESSNNGGDFLDYGLLESENSSVASDLIPDDVKEMMKNETKNDEALALFELGIWNADDFSGNAQDADDEESEDDWSIKTVEEGDEDDTSILDFPKTPPPKIPTPPPEEAPVRILPYQVMLPVGDTPDIWSTSESESSYAPTIYASQFDEYESDVFSKRLQENLFFLPQSIKSEAGDSDMFYCVPSPYNVSLSTDYIQNCERKMKPEDDASKEKKKRKRKELDDQYVKSALKKHAVHDATIVQYGGATKAFRLRMAKLGKDPKITDDKINGRLEKKLRRRLKRKKKNAELTKENVKKLPNISKTAKILRWITVHKKKVKMNVVFENRWIGNEDLTSSMRLRAAGVVNEEGRGNERKASLSVNSVNDGDEVSFEDDKKKEIEEMNREMIMEVGDHGDMNMQQPKKKRLKKKRKKVQCDKKSGRDAESEESFEILKQWLITIQKEKYVENDEDENEVDDKNEDDSPRSEHSSQDKKLYNSDSDSGLSILPPETPGIPRIPAPRNLTPDTEQEPEEEKPPETEKKRKKSTAASKWSLLQPKLQITKKRTSVNKQFAEITRILFEQLSLKTKEYNKLPPIARRSRAFSMDTSRTGYTAQKRSPSVYTSSSKKTKSPVY